MCDTSLLTSPEINGGLIEFLEYNKGQVILVTRHVHTAETMLILQHESIPVEFLKFVAEEDLL